MAAANALLNPLRIPGQVVVDHKRTELEVNALRAGLGGNHDFPCVTEVINQCRAHIGSLGAGDPVGACVPFDPFRIDSSGLGIAYSDPLKRTIPSV